MKVKEETLKAGLKLNHSDTDEAGFLRARRSTVEEKETNIETDSLHPISESLAY